MTINQTARENIARLFDEGTVTGVQGTCKNDPKDIFWAVYKLEPSDATDKVEYSAWASPLYGETIHSYNLGELLDKLEELVERIKKMYE